MATVPLEPENRYTAHQSADLSTTRRPLVPAIRWGAVLAGVVVGVSLQLVLTLLGIASGLSSANVSEGDTVSLGPLLWAGVSMLIAAFVGAYVAGRLSGLKRKADGVLHGMVSWAVTTLLFATLATSAGGAMLNSVFNNMAPGLSRMGSAPQEAAPATDPLTALLTKQLGEDATPPHLRRLVRYIHAGDRETAVEYMVSAMEVPRLRAENLVDQALILTGSSQAASPQAKAAAQRAVGAASMAAWTVFTVVALSLALAIVGGAMGAIGARRTTWGSSSGPLENPS